MMPLLIQRPRPCDPSFFISQSSLEKQNQQAIYGERRELAHVIMGPMCPKSERQVAVCQPWAGGSHLSRLLTHCPGAPGAAHRQEALAVPGAACSQVQNSALPTPSALEISDQWGIIFH